VGRLLDWAARWREEKSKKASWARPQGGKREREKEKEGVGQAQIEKEREKELHSNAFEFKFKWKTNNKTMQWGMKFTKSIFPYVSFYG
jgi:hypothetical protein